MWFCLWFVWNRKGKHACCSATAIEFNEWLYCYSELALAFPIATATRPCPPQLERKGVRAVHAFHTRKKQKQKGPKTLFPLFCGQAIFPDKKYLYKRILRLFSLYHNQEFWVLIITLFSSQYRRDRDGTNNSLTSENLGLCHK